MWDENSIYPRIEAGYSYTRYMNDELVENFLLLVILLKEVLFLKKSFINQEILSFSIFQLKKKKIKLKLIVCEMVISLIL